MRVLPTNFPEVLMIEGRAFEDNRGYFLEAFNLRAYEGAGVSAAFVQQNVSYSHAHVLRGLHFQDPRGQAKLVSVLSGEVFDVCVDVRLGSPTFGRWFGTTLSDANHRQLYIPVGFAHGFVVTGSHALVSYSVTDYWSAAAERSLRWDDPAIGITWPVQDPILSEKDAAALDLEALLALKLAPPYEHR